MECKAAPMQTCEGFEEKLKVLLAFAWLLCLAKRTLSEASSGIEHLKAFKEERESGMF